MSFYKSLLYKDFSDLTILYFNPISDKINVVSHDYDKLTEQLSLDEAEAASRRLRNLGKTISNQALLQEALERDGLVANKKSRQDRQQEILRSTAVNDSKNESLASPVMEAKEVESTTPVQSSSPELEVWDYEQLREEYGF